MFRAPGPDTPAPICLEAAMPPCIALLQTAYPFITRVHAMRVHYNVIPIQRGEIRVYVYE